MGVECSRNVVVSSKVNTWRAAVDIGMDAPHPGPCRSLISRCFLSPLRVFAAIPQSFAFGRLRFRRRHHYSACSPSNVSPFRERWPTVSVCPCYRFQPLSAKSIRDPCPVSCPTLCRIRITFSLLQFGLNAKRIPRVRFRCPCTRSDRPNQECFTGCTAHRVPCIAGMMIKLVASFSTTNEHTGRIRNGNNYAIIYFWLTNILFVNCKSHSVKLYPGLVLYSIVHRFRYTCNCLFFVSSFDLKGPLHFPYP